MAKKSANKIKPILNTKKPRKGIHSKNKSSSNKASKLYKKVYRRQGR